MSFNIVFVLVFLFLQRNKTKKEKRKIFNSSLFLQKISLFLHKHPRHVILLL